MRGLQILAQPRSFIEFPSGSDKQQAKQGVSLALFPTCGLALN